MSKFIKRNTTPVPMSVRKHVIEYLQEKNLGKLVDVRRASDHPDDCYLYHVITKKENFSKLFTNEEYEYSCFTCWNESTKSLNFGHYHLTYEEADKICNDFFHRISGPLVID